MRSIRLALLVYFLGLVTLALGATSLLAYHSAQQTLKDKEEASTRLIQAKHEERCREEQARLDETLLSRAKGLARRVQVQVQPNRLWFREAHVVGVFTAQAAPSAFVLLPLWLGQGVRGPLSYDIFRRNVADLHLPKTELLLPSEAATGEYFQIDSNYWGRPLRSRTMGDHLFPDMQGFANEDMLRWEFDNYELTPGQLVRRVRLKVASARRVSVWPRGLRAMGPAANPPTPPLPPSGSAGPRTSPPRGRHREFPPRFEYPPLTIFVQYAANTEHLDKALQQLGLARDEEIVGLSEQSDLALARQRNQLLAIFFTTFLATILGACWLVWVGLLPLRRLTDAVSKVSPRDFRLVLGDSPMPSELRPIVDRLTGTLDLLKRAFAREKQSTADISHELRTPLAAMLTTLELALRKPRVAEKYREMLVDCHQSALHMNQIVERLLALARLDAGVDRLRPQCVDISELAQQCAGSVRPLAESQGLFLTIHDHCPLPASDTDRAAQLTTDPDKLREVLNNLLHNAVQYNRPDGRIDLTIDRAVAHIEVEIRDTGIGIAPEVRERIFERFFRADPSRSSDGMNAGLGLAIVKEYVELMGGQISVDSVVGQGSAFRVQLPLQTVAPAA